MTIIIDTEYTPNPNALKFILNHPVIKQGTKSMKSPDEADGDKLAQALFGLKGVTTLFYMENFITVSKDESVDWDVLEEEVRLSILDNFNPETKDDTSKAKNDDGIDSNIEKLEKILDERIRPALAMDGGGVEIVALSPSMELTVKYFGACGGCPYSTFNTLKAIEGILQKLFDPKITVVAV